MFEQLVILGLVISTTLVAATGCGRLKEIKRRKTVITASLIIFAFSNFWVTEKSAGHDLGSAFMVWFNSPPYPAGNAIGDNSPSRARYLPELSGGIRTDAPNVPVAVSLTLN